MDEILTFDKDASLVERLRTRSRVVFLAAEEGPAEDISNHLLEAADEIERLRAALTIIAGSSDLLQAAQAKGALENIGAAVK